MSRKSPPYPKEFRAEAVRLVLEQGLSLREASQRIAVAKGTLAGWVANARGPNTEKAPGSRSVAELENEVSSLRKELARTRMEQDGAGWSGMERDGAGYLKKSGDVLCQGIAVRYALMKAWRGQYPVPLMAQALGVCPAPVSMLG